MRYLVGVLGLLLQVHTVFAQHPIKLCGKVSNQNGEAVSAAIFSLPDSIYVANADWEGNFCIRLSPKTTAIRVSYVGCKDVLLSDWEDSLKIQLDCRAASIDTVAIGSDREDFIHKNTPGTVSLSIAEIKKLPVILGETDALKTIALLPGIKQGQEGSSGFHVRGGSPDQNLILMDGAAVYNPTHLLSFFSIFTGESVENIEVIKGSMPAQYGDRLSSIVNIKMKEGDPEKFKGSGGLGLLSSRLSLEGGLGKQKQGSWIVSGRRSFIDLLTTPFLPDAFGKKSGYYFYDLNAKLQLQLGQKDHLSFTGYTGGDIFNFTVPTGTGINIHVDWGNQAAALNWKHFISNRVYSQTSATYSNYHINYDSKLGENTLKINSGIRSYSGKQEFVCAASDFAIFRLGGQITSSALSPGIATGEQSAVAISSDIPVQHTLQAAGWLGSDWTIQEEIQINAGIRYSWFDRRGPFKDWVYDSLGAPTSQLIEIPRGQSLAQYHGWEPRFAITYAPNPDFSLKAAYTRSYQYIQLVTSSAALLPTDFWSAASATVKPQIGDQFSLGYYRTFHSGIYQVSLESYYRNMQNQIEFKAGMPLVFNENVDKHLVFGKGRAYGMELLLKKTKGKTTGWVAYTLSRSERTFPDLNQGKTFLYRYDRRHDFTLTLMRKLSPKWQASMMWTIATGAPVTLAYGNFPYFTGTSSQTATLADLYSNVNNAKLPTYHRADMAFTYTRRPNSSKRFKSSWNFSIYNVYNRLNPYFLYIDRNATGQNEVVGVSVLPCIPSVTWNFSF